MTKTDIIETAPFLLSFRELVNFFEKQYGELKLKDIFEKVETSKKVNKFLRETFERRVRPGTNDYLAVIHSSTSFTFAKAETVFMASSILLYKWNDAICQTLHTSGDYYLNNVFFSLLQKCDGYKTHISTTFNFFNDYFSYLSDYIDNSRFGKR